MESLIGFEAASGIDGLEILKSRNVDLILSDINMPSMDGLEFVRQLKVQELAQGVPVVMITTESSEAHVKQAIEAGAKGYIRKPFTADQVKQRVLPLLAVSRKARDRDAFERRKSIGIGARIESRLKCGGENDADVARLDALGFRSGES